MSNVSLYTHVRRDETETRDETRHAALSARDRYPRERARKFVDRPIVDRRPFIRATTKGGRGCTHTHTRVCVCKRSLCVTEARCARAIRRVHDDACRSVAAQRVKTRRDFLSRPRERLRGLGTHGRLAIRPGVGRNPSFAGARSSERQERDATKGMAGYLSRERSTLHAHAQVAARSGATETFSNFRSKSRSRRALYLILPFHRAVTHSVVTGRRRRDTSARAYLG